MEEMGDKMEVTINKPRTVLILSMIGIFSAILTALSDLVLLGRPASGFSFLRLGTESMAGLAQWRITAGTFVGVFLLPFQIAGLISLYYGLRPAGKLLPAAVLLIDAHALTMGVAFHTSYAYIGSAWTQFHDNGSDSGPLSEILQRFGNYWRILLFIMLAELIIGSAAYILLVLSGKTLYPKWMALFNPLFLFFVLLLAILPIPEPVGGFVGPAVLNLSTLAFFILSAAIIYKKLKRRKEAGISQ
jgi:hypothetical protein